MDLSFKKEDYKYLKVLSESVLEESVECDITLPEYMPEILRIVKTNAVTKVNSCRTSGDRVTVDGVCELRLIYTAEDGGLYSYTYNRTYTKYRESDSLSQAIDVISRPAVSYVNSKATGTRRVEIKAGITLKIIAYSQECEEILIADNTCGFEQKLVDVNAMSLGCRKTGSFSMSDSIIPEISAAFVISSYACAICNDIKKINNKLMIRGEAVVNVCCVKDKDRTETYVIKHSMPINQILEFEGMEERYTGNVSLNVSGVDIISKGEASGEITGFDISLDIDVTVNMWETKTISLISDAYGVGAHLDIKRLPYKYYSAITEMRETVVGENKTDIPDEGMRTVVNVTGEVISSQFKKEDNKATVSGSINAYVLLKDDNGNYSNVIKTIDYCCEKEIDSVSEQLVCDPSTALLSIDCAMVGSVLEMRAEVNVTATIFEELIIETVVDVKQSDIPFNEKRNAITVYFPEGNEESLWSIARRYNTTVSAIAEENNLDGDTTGDLKIVFIPAV